MKHYRIGVIGLGGMAQGHIREIRQMGSASIIAICDINNNAVMEVGEQLNVPMEKRYTDYHRLIQDPEVDVIVSVTPNNIHAEIIKACLAEQKPFMAEKPFTLTFAEAEELLELYQKNPVPCMIGFSYRYTPAFRFARELIKSGKLGNVRSIFIQYLQGWGAVQYNAPYLWRFNKEITGTGTLGDLGSHMIDMAHYLVGQFEELSAQLQTLVPEREDLGTSQMIKIEVDDFASFQSRMENGVMGVFQTSRNALGSGNQHEVSVYGDFGTIHASTLTPDELVWIHEEADSQQTVRKIIPVPGRVKIRQWDDFFQMLGGSAADGLPGFMDGYNNQKVLEAILKSNESRQAVSL